jgi:hypothetical protein
VRRKFAKSSRTRSRSSIPEFFDLLDRQQPPLAQGVAACSSKALSSTNPSVRTSQVATTLGADRAGSPSMGTSSVRGTDDKMPRSGGINDRVHRNSAMAGRIVL